MERKFCKIFSMQDLFEKRKTLREKHPEGNWGKPAPGTRLSPYDMGEKEDEDPQEKED